MFGRFKGLSLTFTFEDDLSKDNYGRESSLVEQPYLTDLPVSKLIFLYGFLTHLSPSTFILVILTGMCTGVLYLVLHFFCGVSA